MITAPAPEEEASRLRDHLVAALVTLALFAGTIKATPLVRWLPIDLTLLACGMLSIALVVHVIGQGTRLTIRTGGILLTASLFPPALRSVPVGYHSEKLVGLGLTLLLVVAAVYLVGDSRRGRLWLHYMTVAGLLTALALFVLPSDATQYGRTVFEGSNTISTGRMSGVAVVLLATLALVPNRTRLRVAAACGAGFAGAAMLLTGSRGPLLAAVVVLLLVALRVNDRRRGVRLLLLAGLFAAGWIFITSDGSTGTQRIEASLTGEASSTSTRQPVWGAALRALATMPQSVGGTGWGGFISVMRSGEVLPSGDRQYPHNVFLEVFVEGGWLTGSAIALFIVLSLVKLWRGAGTPVGLSLLALSVFALVNANVSGDVNDNRVLWVTLALAWCVRPPAADTRLHPDPEREARANRLPPPVLHHA